MCIFLLGAAPVDPKTGVLTRGLVSDFLWTRQGSIFVAGGLAEDSSAGCHRGLFVLHDDLAEVQSLVAGARSTQDVFPAMALQDLSTDERLVLLEEEYVVLVRRLRPERFGSNSLAQNSARHLLSKLYDWHQRAVRELESARPASEPDAPTSTPTADTPSVRPPPPRLRSVPTPSPNSEVDFTVNTPSGSYQVTRILAQGDLAMLYRGACLSGPKAGQDVTVKIAMQREDSDLLMEEARIVRTLQAAEGAQRKHLPELVDQFLAPSGQAGSIFAYLDGFDLDMVRERYPLGLNAEHVAWILARSLSALGFAHQQGIIHGNVEPAHILVRPADHNVFVIDWTYAVVAPEKTGQGFRAHNPDFSPPEVMARKPPLPASDIYSLGKTMIFLLGGDVRQGTIPAQVDERFARFLEFLIRDSPRQRAQDAWEVAEQLKQLRQEVFGPSRFLPLEM